MGLERIVNNNRNHLLVMGPSVIYPGSGEDFIVKFGIDSPFEITEDDEKQFYNSLDFHENAYNKLGLLLSGEIDSGDFEEKSYWTKEAMKMARGFIDNSRIIQSISKVRNISTKEFKERLADVKKGNVDIEEVNFGIDLLMQYHSDRTHFNISRFLDELKTNLTMERTTEENVYSATFFRDYVLDSTGIIPEDLGKVSRLASRISISNRDRFENAIDNAELFRRVTDSSIGSLVRQMLLNIDFDSDYIANTVESYHHCLENGGNKREIRKIIRRENTNRGAELIRVFSEFDFMAKLYLNLVNKGQADRELVFEYCMEYDPEDTVLTGIRNIADNGLVHNAASLVDNLTHLDDNELPESIWNMMNENRLGHIVFEDYMQTVQENTPNKARALEMLAEYLTEGNAFVGSVDLKRIRQTLLAPSEESLEFMDETTNFGDLYEKVRRLGSEMHSPSSLVANKRGQERTIKDEYYKHISKQEVDNAWRILGSDDARRLFRIAHRRGNRELQKFINQVNQYGNTETFRILQSDRNLFSNYASNLSNDETLSKLEEIFEDEPNNPIRDINRILLEPSDNSIPVEIDNEQNGVRIEPQRYSRVIIFGGDYPTQWRNRIKGEYPERDYIKFMDRQRRRYIERLKNIDEPTLVLYNVLYASHEKENFLKVVRDNPNIDYERCFLQGMSGTIHHLKQRVIHPSAK